jgi:hypothetical protein
VKAKDFSFEVGDRAKIVHAWGEEEEGLIVDIAAEGDEVIDVALDFGGEYGLYMPEQILPPSTPLPPPCDGYGPEGGS